MIGRKKTLFRSLILILCCVFLCSTAAALGSLRVTVLDEKYPVENIAVEVCRVADLNNGVFTLTEAFADLRLSPEDLVKELTAEQAEQVYQFVMQKGLEGTIHLTDGEGNADFYTIPDGLYLVFERGDQAIAFRPYLVTIPTGNSYGIYSVPKTNSGDVKHISVFKEWEDNENAAGKRPESIQITLSHNGTPVRSVTLNEECGWEHTFLMLPTEGEYTVKENDIPDYIGTCEAVFEGFLLTNTYIPGEEPEDPEEPKPKPDPKPHPRPDIPVKPDEIPEDPELPAEPELPEEEVPTLPQTGFLMWPIYGMLALGVALTVFGLADICLGKETVWEEEQEEP